MSEEPGAADRLAGCDEALCPNCLAVLAEGTHFCQSCGAPVSGISVLDPMGSVYARGFGYGRAASRPAALMTVIGIWMLFAPGCALMSLFGAWLTLQAARVEGLWPGAVIPILLCFSGALLFGAIVWKTTRNYLRRPQARDEEDSDADPSEPAPA